MGGGGALDRRVQQKRMRRPKRVHEQLTQVERLLRRWEKSEKQPRLERLWLTALA